MEVQAGSGSYAGDELLEEALEACTVDGAHMKRPHGAHIGVNVKHCEH